MSEQHGLQRGVEAAGGGQRLGAGYGRADVVGIFPNEVSIVRFVGAVPQEAGEEWQLQHRSLFIEPLANISADDGGEKYMLAPPAAPITTIQVERAGALPRFRDRRRSVSRRCSDRTLTARLGRT
jgi:hypothetical protein